MGWQGDINNRFNLVTMKDNKLRNILSIYLEVSEWKGFKDNGRTANISIEMGEYGLSGYRDIMLKANIREWRNDVENHVKERVILKYNGDRYQLTGQTKNKPWWLAFVEPME